MAQARFKQLNEWCLYLVFSLICLTALFVDNSNLPQGFESAKVTWLQALAVGVLIIMPSLLLWQLYIEPEKFSLQLKARMAPLLLILLCFLAFFLSSIFSPKSELAFLGSEWRHFGLITVSALMLLAVFFLLFSNTRHLPYYLLIYLVIGTIHLVFGLADAWKFRNNITSYGDFINGQFGQANFYADYLLGLLLICVYAYVKAKIKTQQIMVVIILILILYVLSLTQSRGAFVVLTVTSVLWGINILGNKLKINRKLKLAGLLTLTIVAALVMMFYIYNNELSRQLYWQDVSQLISKQPQLGYGSDTLLAVSQECGLFNGRIVDRSHNLLFDLLYWYGFLGLCAVSINLGLLASKLLGQRQLSLEQKVLLTLLLIFFFSSLVHTKSVFQYMEVGLWIVLLNVSTGKATIL